MLTLKQKYFINRNKKRNSYLYTISDDKEGIDFIKCPVLGTRTLNIKKQYIEGVLGLSVEEFKQKYPNAKTICEGQAKNIKKSLSKEIDGVTKHQLSVIKATESRAKIGEDGLTTNQRKGLKTKATHMKIGEDGLTGYQRLAKIRNEKILDNGLSVQQNSLKKRLQTIISGNKSKRAASKISKKVLKPILEYLNKNNIKYYFDTNEYLVSKGDEHFYYDLIIPDFNMCIEYQSKLFHPNPFWLDDKWNNWSCYYKNEILANSETKWNYDKYKAKFLYEHRNIKTWFVWEDTRNHDVQTILAYMETVNV